MSQQRFEITIPPGVNGGDKITVAVPDGRQMQITIPPGMGPGQKLQVAAPPPAQSMPMPVAAAQSTANAQKLRPPPTAGASNRAKSVPTAPNSARPSFLNGNMRATAAAKNSMRASAAGALGGGELPIDTQVAAARQAEAEALDAVMTKTMEMGLQGVYRSDVRKLLQQHNNNVQQTIEELTRDQPGLAGGGALSTGHGDLGMDALALVPPKVRLQRAEEYLPPKVMPMRVDRHPNSVSRATRAAHELPEDERRGIAPALNALEGLTSNAQLRYLEEHLASIPSQLSRAQACALLRTFDNPLRRKDGLALLSDKLSLSAAPLEVELLNATWPEDIRRLFGDPI